MKNNKRFTVQLMSLHCSGNWPIARVFRLFLESTLICICMVAYGDNGIGVQSPVVLIGLPQKSTPLPLPMDRLSGWNLRNKDDPLSRRVVIHRLSREDRAVLKTSCRKLFLEKPQGHFIPSRGHVCDYRNEGKRKGSMSIALAVGDNPVVAREMRIRSIHSTTHGTLIYRYNVVFFVAGDLLSFFNACSPGSHWPYVHGISFLALSGIFWNLKLTTLI